MISFKKDFFAFFIIFILSIILLFDLLTNPARPITFDAHVHMTTFSQFAQALQDQEFPVTWSDNFANYGSPLPLYAHQVSSYLGGLLVMSTKSSILSYNILLFLSVFLSSLFLYKFLKIYFKSNSSLVATAFYHFTAYRIINIFIRGALPEILASVFLPLILIFIHKYLVEKKPASLLYLIASFTLLILTHPMMFVVFSFAFLPYFLFLLLKNPKNCLKKLLVFSFTLVISLGISAYYLMPLILEMKYFYQGNNPLSFAADQFLGLENYLSHKWYFFKTHPGPRGNFIKFGILESLSLLALAFTFIFDLFKKKKLDKLVALAFSLSLFLIFLTLPAAKIFYEKLFFLSQLQFPWRILSALSFFPAFFLAYMLNRFNNKILILSVLSLILIFRIPQSYGKNFILQDQSNFDFTSSNLHSQNLQPKWTGRPDDYPVQPDKVAILEGEGEITNLLIKNASRNFTAVAKTELKMTDYTFYFPGWTLLVNGEEKQIEFQDPDNRGVITYIVPAGEHKVELKYQDTKLRLLAKAISTFSLISLGTLALFFLKNRVNFKAIIVGD